MSFLVLSNFVRVCVVLSFFVSPLLSSILCGWFTTLGFSPSTSSRDSGDLFRLRRTGTHNRRTPPVYSTSDFTRCLRVSPSP